MNHEKRNNAESQSVCLVMGSPVDKTVAEKKGLAREYHGKKYYFCCAGCAEKFEQDPESYIKNASTPRKQGGCC